MKVGSEEAEISARTGSLSFCLVVMSGLRKVLGYLTTVCDFMLLKHEYVAHLKKWPNF